MSIDNTKIGIVGIGNMGSSILQGLLKVFDSNNIIVFDTNKKLLEKISKLFLVRIAFDIKEICNFSHLVVLAVKPQVAKEVCNQLTGHIKKENIVLSTIAGLSVLKIANYCHSNCTIVRCMPNMAAKIALSTSALYSQKITNISKKLVDKIANTIGTSFWLVNEGDFDVITSLSGSGPAYFFLLIKSMVESATKMGLDKKIAYKLATHTALGSCYLACDSKNIDYLISSIISPNGTTYAAMEVFYNKKFVKIVDDAMRSAKERSYQLGKEN